MISCGRILSMYGTSIDCCHFSTMDSHESKAEDKGHAISCQVSPDYFRVLTKITHSWMRCSIFVLPLVYCITQYHKQVVWLQVTLIALGYCHTLVAWIMTTSLMDRDEKFSFAFTLFVHVYQYIFWSPLSSFGSLKRMMPIHHLQGNRSQGTLEENSQIFNRHFIACNSLWVLDPISCIPWSVVLWLMV